MRPQNSGVEKTVQKYSKREPLEKRGCRYAPLKEDSPIDTSLGAQPSLPSRPPAQTGFGNAFTPSKLKPKVKPVKRDSKESLPAPTYL